ncbi:hypothetical protein BS78_02G373900 [Paspalum vaginatum]|nr:hypothetical protein BS78_02G373900 [Paspalum vaginatum]
MMPSYFDVWDHMWRVLFDLFFLLLRRFLHFWKFSKAGRLLQGDAEGSGRLLQGNAEGVRSQDLCHQGTNVQGVQEHDDVKWQIQLLMFVISSIYGCDWLGDFFFRSRFGSSRSRVSRAG